MSIFASMIRLKKSKPYSLCGGKKENSLAEPSVIDLMYLPFVADSKHLQRTRMISTLQLPLDGQKLLLIRCLTLF